MDPNSKEHHPNWAHHRLLRTWYQQHGFIIAAESVWDLPVTTVVDALKWCKMGFYRADWTQPLVSRGGYLPFIDIALKGYHVEGPPPPAPRVAARRGKSEGRAATRPSQPAVHQ